jgi:AraC-like DNA-binding protein
MNHAYHRPNEQLAEYVRTILVLEGSATADTHDLPIFTNGMPTLLCKTEKDISGFEKIVQLTLFGNSIPSDCWAMNNHTTIIAYFFKPFTLASLFKCSNKELTTNPVDLSSWSPHKFNALKTQLIYAGTTAQKIEVLNHLLIQQRIENKELYETVQHATDKILHNPANDILPELLKELNLNERTFQRIFKKYVGITPTQYRRICQFQFSFDQIRSNQFDKMSDVAFDNGFSDQSHFIRTFKEFTQITPNEYLQKGLTGEEE